MDGKKGSEFLFHDETRVRAISRSSREIRKKTKKKILMPMMQTRRPPWNGIAVEGAVDRTLSL